MDSIRRSKIPEVRSALRALRQRTAVWRKAIGRFSCACFKRAKNPANPYAGEAKKPDPAAEIKQPV